MVKKIQCLVQMNNNEKKKSNKSQTFRGFCSGLPVTGDNDDNNR